MTDLTSDEVRTSTNSSLEYLRGAQSKFSLQHLARMVVIHAMSRRCLLDDVMSNLDIPKHLHPYVLFKFKG